MRAAGNEACVLVGQRTAGCRSGMMECCAILQQVVQLPCGRAAVALALSLDRDLRPGSELFAAAAAAW